MGSSIKKVDKSIGSFYHAKSITENENEDSNRLENCIENESGSESKNEQEIFPPALLMNDNHCEWDSALDDDTKSNVTLNKILQFSRSTFKN